MPGKNKTCSDGLKVLHVANGYMYGGVETALVMMARHRTLCPRMVPEFAVCFSGRLYDEIGKTGVPVYMIGDDDQGMNLKADKLRSGLKRIIEENDYDAVICHMLMMQAVFGSLIQEHGIKNFLYTHGVTPPVWEWWARQIPPDYMIYNSRHMRRTSSHLFQNVPGSVVYYPMQLPELILPPCVRAEKRKAFDTPAESIVVIHVARLEPMKGHRELIRALGKLDDLDSWQAWFVGGPQREKEDEYLHELQRMTGRLAIAERVHFLGQRSDVPELLRCADILCQPNLETESFGMSYIEAEFAGLPVITTAFGGALEAVGEGCGILVQPNDQAALENALRDMIESPELREKAKVRGPKHAREMCDPKTNLHSLYESLKAGGSLSEIPS